MTNQNTNTNAASVETDQSRLQDHVDSIAKGLSTSFSENEKGQTWDKESYPVEDGQEEMSAMDWLQDSLDFNWILNSDKSFKSARVLVAFGGPNIWVDFENKIVEGFWWGSYAKARFEDVNDIEEALREIYHC